MSMKDWWPTIERPQADKTEARGRLASDVEAFLASGGVIEQGVSVQLRCVQSTDTHARTRVVYSDTARIDARASLKTPFNRHGPEPKRMSEVKRKQGGLA